ncbi:hypothetical protein A3835_01035 [Campylobacter concisus]|uniref:Uncharacterized protein n=1 Tax=Campylobacter concisus TaxID=199 RepID=A0A1X0U475_9BACT|nr:hypothetical protein A3835_01035 [Campylobacter concisus]
MPFKILFRHSKTKIYLSRLAFANFLETLHTYHLQFKFIKYMLILAFLNIHADNIILSNVGVLFKIAHYFARGRLLACCSDM